MTTAADRHDRHLGRLVGLVGIALVAASLVSVLVLWAVKHHARTTEAARLAAEVDRGPLVTVARAGATPPERDVTLTADVRGYFQTTLYAKVSGYVRDVRVDKGDHVTKGEILGTVESPETDQALFAAEASAALQKKLAGRARALAPDVVAQQDLDTARSNLDVSRASLRSAQALQRYEVIEAPFDGVITARYVDPGALLPAATGGTQSALPFVDVGVTNRVRVDAYVGQDTASLVRPGDPVVVWQDDRPELRIPTTLTRTAGALDPRTRTMLVEVELDNRTYALLPGTFANVTIHTTAPPRAEVPAAALVVRGGKDMLARVEGDRVHLVEVKPGRTDGKTIEILAGVKPGDAVALDLPVELADGAVIQPVEKPPEQADGGTKAP